MPGDKGWKSPIKTVETLPQEQKGDIHVNEDGELHFPESDVASFESESAIEATQEYLKMSPDQIRVTLTVLFRDGNTTE